MNNATRIDEVFAVAVTRDERIYALASVIERELASMCNEGGDPPDGAPLTAWRLSELLEELSGDVNYRESMRIRIGALAAEAS